MTLNYICICRVLSSLAQVAPMLESLMANRTDLKQSLWSVNVWLEQSAFVMKKLEGKFKVCICVNGVIKFS